MSRSLVCRRQRHGAGDVAAAAEAAVSLLVAKVALALLPFSVVARALGRRCEGADSSPSAPAEQYLAAEALRCRWAVGAAIRRVPFEASCLPRAIAGQLMLRRRGVAATVVFGVARRDGEWLNHAWLEVDGAAVLGYQPAISFRRVVEYRGAPLRLARHQGR